MKKNHNVLKHNFNVSEVAVKGVSLIGNGDACKDSMECESYLQASLRRVVMNPVKEL